MNKKLLTIFLVIGVITFILIFLGYKDYQRQSKIEMKLKPESSAPISKTTRLHG